VKNSGRSILIVTFRSIVGLVMFGLLFSTAMLQRVQADELYGRVRGIVTDSTGAALEGVDLKLHNVGTGATEDALSDSNGSFNFINLKPGQYSLTATRDGFKTFEVSGIKVEPNEIYVQNVPMELGGVSETIEVAANQAEVEQTSMQLTATIDAKTITDLPLLGRNWVNLQQTLPGVVTPDTRFGTNFSTNGSQAQQNSYLVNGADSNDLPLNSPQVVPNPDAIEEVKMVTNTINPEFGRNSGAIINAVTKSGTNSFHGDVFEFYRDTFLNTHNFFQKTPQIFHQNLFGGTIGGPIWKNKLFFFYGIQITRARQPDANFSGNPTVFTSAQLAGNFDPTLISSNPIPFAGGLQGPNGNCPQNTPYNACFTGGVVPTSNFNPLSTQLVKTFVPLPNINGNQFALNPVTSVKTNQHIGRLDYNFRQNDSIWFYALANDSSSINTLPFTGATLPGFGDQNTPFTKQFTASWSHIFNSNVLNEFRVGYTRLNFLSGIPNTVRQPASVGFPSITPQLASGADYPQINITGYFTLGGTTNGPQPRKDQTYQITDNFSWNKGKHSLKFGYDGRKFQVWNPFANSNDGAFSFGGAGSFTSGDPGLDFLLGIPDTYSQGSGSVIMAQAYEHYLYAQDQWRIRNNLTITIGTGYQIDTPIREFQNRGISRACFQPGVQSTVFPTAPVGYTLAGDPGCNDAGGASTKYNHLGPRLGFAYTPGSPWLGGGSAKTSIRGGFGIYYNRSEEELNLQDLGLAPFGLNSQGVTSASTATTTFSPSFPNPFLDISSGFSVGNPFPYVPPGPGATNINFAAFEPLGFNLNVIPKNFTDPYSMNFNLTVEHELPGQMIFRVGYVGAIGRKLITSYTFNPITPAGLQLCLADPTCTSAKGRANLPFNHPDYYPFDGSIWGSPGQQTNGGYSNYNSLQVVLDKHFSHGLQFFSAYTYAHSLDVSSSFEDTAFLSGGGVNPSGHFGRDYGSSAFDARHRWSLTAIYEIPSLKHLWSAAPGKIVEGWRLTGLNAIQTGFPVLLQDSSNRSLTCDLFQSYYSCPDRPDLVSVPVILDPRTAVFNGKNDYWFNPASFTHNAIGTLGNVGRGYLRGPGYWNTDFSIQKDTAITERMKIQLRLEVYNVFNHTNFANPNGNVNSGNFGRISAIRSFTNPREAQLAAKFFF
jgi:Carboxypeptidase regulatory-like domain